MNAQIPMKTSMNTLTVAVTASIQPGWEATPSAAAWAGTGAGVMPPAATAAPSVLTASPIQAAATRGSCDMKASAIAGRTKTSITAKTTTSEDTSPGTCGRARIAPPVAIAAATPQIDIPEASGAD